MKKLFGYIRVSTARQGEHGVSLQEQRDAIERFAQRSDIEIERWFEERVTAAKKGRPMFNEMLKLLRQGRSDGIVIHKIDRGARNLKDWSDLGELIDEGIEVHFANESLDMNSRGGRLSADIQAVVAADFIRNLRQETKKGFYGRIKQGYYPMQAPIGYLDKGAGMVKEPDPARAPFVQAAFELYGSGRYNLGALTEELYRQGLRNRRGGPVSINGMSKILNNPFYIGIIRLQSTGETFPGAHEPLVRKSLFDRVHYVLRGKVNARLKSHQFRYRRLIKCRQCGFSLIGETQKSHAYYRCHTKSCPPTCVREESIYDAVDRKLYPLELGPEERRVASAKIAGHYKGWEADQAARVKALEIQHGQTDERLGRLTDAYIEKLIDRNLFEERKNGLLLQRKELDEKIGLLKSKNAFVAQQLTFILELCGAAYSLHNLCLPDENRTLLEIVTSNRWASGKRIEITLALPFLTVADRQKHNEGTPERGTPRTLDRMIDELIAWIEENPDTDFSGAHDLIEKHSPDEEEEKEWKLAA